MIDASQPVSPMRTRSRLLIVSWYALAILWGGRQAYYWLPSALDFIWTPIFGFVLCHWAIADSLLRGRPIPLLARQYVLLGAFIAVPLYIVWSRGWRGFAWTIAQTVGLVVTMTAAMYLGGWALLGAEWFQ